MKDKRVLLGELINDRLHRRGLRAKDVAQRADIHESTLSAIRRGSRGVSREMVEAIVRALSASEEEEEQDLNEFLLAAGFGPRTLSKKRPVVIELLNKDALLEIEASMRQENGKHIWVFSPGLIETFQREFFKIVCENLAAGVSYTYFFHYRNALHWRIFVDELRDRGNFKPNAQLKGYVLPDEAFRSKDANLFECVYDAENEESFKVYRTSREIENEFLYREVNKQEASETREYLREFMRIARGKKEPPCNIEVFLTNEYGPDILKPSRKATNR